MKHFTNKIEAHMTEHPCFASRKTPVSEAVEFMTRMDFRHLPIIEKGMVVGVVSERDLKQAKMFSAAGLLLEDIMTPEPYCVTVGTPLSLVAEEMARHKYGSAVVLDDERAVVGIFTTTDAMKILSQCIREYGVGTAIDRGIEDFLSGNTLI